jgi:WD40 repeat protein
LHSRFPLLQSYFGGLLCCQWSPDGRYVAAAGEDDSVSVYGVEEGCLVAVGQGHSSWVAAVAFDDRCGSREASFFLSFLDFLKTGFFFFLNRPLELTALRFVVHSFFSFAPNPFLEPSQHVPASGLSRRGG